MKAVSLFAGVGGFDLALERNGAEVVASVEIDKHARKVLANRFPNSTILEDVKSVTGKQLFELGFNSDGIIVGGFPCQDLSVAGKRRGLAGERSGLFFEVTRLLDETKAKWFILENVPGLLSSNGGRDMGIILGALAELGYGVAYRILDAQYFGVPQRRRRVFIVGCLGDDGRTPAQILSLIEGRTGYSAKSNKKRENIANETSGGSRISSGEIVGTLQARDYKGLNHEGVRDGKAIVTVAALTVSDLTKGQTSHQSIASGFLQVSNVPMIFDNSDESKVYEPKSAFEENWAESEVKNALRANASKSSHVVVFDPHRSDGARIQGDTVNTLTSMMGTGGNNTPMVAYPMHGAMIGRKDTAGPGGSGFQDENKPSYTLTASSQARHGVVAATENDSVVRRLTPVECERLQGFPDNWTEGQADTHRYKQMGNAVAVPVVEWIVKRLMEAK